MARAQVEQVTSPECHDDVIICIVEQLFFHVIGAHIKTVIRKSEVAPRTTISSIHRVQMRFHDLAGALEIPHGNRDPGGIRVEDDTFHVEVRFIVHFDPSFILENAINHDYQGVILTAAGHLVEVGIVGVTSSDYVHEGVCVQGVEPRVAGEATHDLGEREREAFKGIYWVPEES